MNIGIVGAGNMGRAIATQLGAVADVSIADRHPDKADAVAAEIGGGVTAASIEEVLGADVVVLALWYPGTLEFAREHASELAGKVVVDIANPVDETWVRLATDPSTSSAELLAAQLPDSRVVKAFNTDTAVVLRPGEVDGVPLDVFVASNDEQAKQEVMGLVDAAGLRPLDAGALDNARLLERLTAFQIELGVRYDLDQKMTFKFLSNSPIAPGRRSVIV
jgi:NADPH-dependent F420 reductase